MSNTTIDLVKGAFNTPAGSVELPRAPVQHMGSLIVPQTAHRRAEVTYSDKNMLVTVEQFNNEQDKLLTRRAGDILTKTFPNYGWYVRAIGSSKSPTGLGIGLAELVQWGGSQTVMYFNPQDFGLATEFEAKVKALGAELLERARLNRGKKIESQLADQMPDGFEGLVPNKRKKYKLVESVDELMKSVKSTAKSN